jgi:hypothetical protein
MFEISTYFSCATFCKEHFHLLAHLLISDIFHNGTKHFNGKSFFKKLKQILAAFTCCSWKDSFLFSSSKGSSYK